MSLLDIFRGKNKKSKGQVQNSVSTANSADALILRYFQDKSETDALKLSAVFSAISIISNTMSKLPFQVIDRNTKKRVDDKSLYNVLNMQANSKMNVSVMNKMIWTWILTEGEAYCIPLRKFRSTEIEQLVPVHPSKVTKVLDENNNLYYDVDMGKGKPKQRLRYDEIIHLKALTLNGIDGISPLEYARMTVQTGLNQETFTEDFYKNYGRPLDYLKTATDLSSKKTKVKKKNEEGKLVDVEVSMKDVMRESWKEAHAGDNRFAIAILDNGLEYGTVPQITPEQMQFVSSKTVNVEDIARFFDMSSCLFKLGVGKQTYSTNEQAQICYITETIIPKLRQWEQELTLKLLTDEQREKGWVIKGNIEAELHGDMMTQANYFEKMRSMGVMNTNEIREKLDKESIGEIGDVRFVGPNYVPMERLISGESAGDVTPNPTKEEDDE